MLNKLKPLMAVLLIVLTIVGSVITIVGGPIKPLKKQLKYGLDINGGVYVVMEGETKAKGEQLDTLMRETKGVIENRVNTMGISEANVTIEGKKRIRVELPGVKDADSAIKQIIEIISKEEIDILVVGLPRNQSGEETSQTVYTKEFVKNFEYSVDRIDFQDESLTSIQAENRLKSYGKPYSKGDIDMNAASIILQDYLEENF